MAFKVSGREGCVVHVACEGKASWKEYGEFLRALNGELGKRDSVGLLLEISEDFAGFDVISIGAHMALNMGYVSRIRRIAVVGAKKWGEWIEGNAGPYLRMEAKRFAAGGCEKAEKWLSK